MSKHHYLTATAIAMLLGATPVLAGNMPQYMFAAKNGTFTPLTGATPLSSMSAEGLSFVLPGGIHNPNECESEGWDLGMTFRFGGQEFNRFIVSSQGRLLLGKDVVNTETAFNVHFSNVKLALSQTDISYKIEGTEGNHVFTLQYANCVTSEDSRFKGRYNLQIRLHEATGQVETIFNQVEAPWTNFMGFNIGLTGWNPSDVLRVQGKALNNFSTLSTDSKEHPNMLEHDSYVIWDRNYEEPFTVVYTFSPVLSTDAPAGSPAGLTLSQKGSNINVHCERDPNAPATVIMWSHEPFTASDYPTDGVTFNAGETAIFGNAHAVYYGDEAVIDTTIEGVGPNEDYYVQALSVTGYPVYGKATPAEAVFHTTQAAPSMVKVVPASDTQVKLNVRANDRIIVAKTTEHVGGWMPGLTGVFGRPEAEMTVGDIIEGGGTVVYTGEPGEFLVDVDKNQVNYFRAWTVKDGDVSATHQDGAGVPVASIPYSVQAKDYPLGERPIGWESSAEQFVSFSMEYNKVDVLRATTSEGTTLNLYSPDINLDVPTVLKFDYALEACQYVFAESTAPGKFGADGFLKVIVDGEELADITNYDGTMVPVDALNWEYGSAELKHVEVNIPAKGNSNIQFACRTEKPTLVFLRNIEVIDPNYVAVDTIGSDNDEIDFTQPIYTVTGMRVRANSASELPAGLYIVGGRKVMVR